MLHVGCPFRLVVNFKAVCEWRTAGDTNQQQCMPKSAQVQDSAKYPVHHSIENDIDIDVCCSPVCIGGLSSYVCIGGFVCKVHFNISATRISEIRVALDSFHNIY
jgi:hypothetical protein